MYKVQVHQQKYCPHSKSTNQNDLLRETLVHSTPKIQLNNKVKHANLQILVVRVYQLTVLQCTPTDGSVEQCTLQASRLSDPVPAVRPVSADHHFLYRPLYHLLQCCHFHQSRLSHSIRKGSTFKSQYLIMERIVLLRRQNSVAKLVQVDISKWKDAAAVKTTLGAKSGLLWRRGQALRRGIKPNKPFPLAFCPTTKGNTTASREKAFVLSVCSWCWANHFSFFDLLNTPLESLKKAVIKMQSWKCGHRTRN